MPGRRYRLAFPPSSQRDKVLPVGAEEGAGAGDGASAISRDPWGFFIGPEGGTHAGDDGQALLGKRDAAGARGGGRLGDRDEDEDGRPQVLRPARLVAAHDPAGDGVRRVRVRRGARLRRLVDSRMAGDRGERHAPDAGSGLRDARPLRGGANPLPRLRDCRPAHGKAVRARPAPCRPPGGGASTRDRDRRHGPLRARVRVLRLRRRLVHARREPRRLRGRLDRRTLELRASPGSATPFARRAATSRPRRTTRSPTCAPRWC